MHVKSTATAALKFAIAFGLIGWMIAKGMLGVSSLAVLANPASLLVSLSLVFSVIFINTMRWTLLLKIKGFSLASTQTLPLALIGIFFNFALPSGVGGDVVKGYYLLKGCSGRKAAAATTLLMDRFIGMTGMVLVASAVILMEYPKMQASPELHLLSLGVAGLLLLMAGFFALAFSASLKSHPFIQFLFRRLPGGSILQTIYDAVHSYRDHPLALLQALLLSFFSQSLIVAFVWFFAGITGAPAVPVTVYLFMVPLGLISTLLPITPAGLGVGQAAFYYLYQAYTGLDSQIGPNAYTAYQVILLCWGMVGAWFYVARRNEMKEPAA